MRQDREAMMVVRAELCDRLDRLRRISGRYAARDFSEGVEAIRVMATVYGMEPVARLAEALGRSASGRRAGCSTNLYLDRLGDAIGCERSDDQASETMLASVSVRLGA